MAGSVLQTVAGSTSSAGTTQAVAFTTQNVTAGSLLLACAAWQSDTPTCALSDTQTNTWTPVAGSLATSSPAGFKSQWFWAVAGAGGVKPTVTMTVSQSVNEKDLGILELAGMNTTTPVVTSNAAIGSTANPTLNVTTSTAGDWVFGFTLSFDSPTVPGGYTAGPAPGGNPSHYLRQTSPGVTAVTFTATAALWALSSVVIAEAAGGAAPIVSPLLVSSAMSYAAHRAASV